MFEIVSGAKTPPPDSIEEILATYGETFDTLDLLTKEAAEQMIVGMSRDQTREYDGARYTLQRVWLRARDELCGDVVGEFALVK